MDTMFITKKHQQQPPCVPKPMMIHKDSHVISKPKIRIIHIFAPEIIKTDVANFRELVQRLTGKPTESNSKKRPRELRAADLCSKKMELRSGFRPVPEFRERIKGEEEIWASSGSVPMNGGFLGGFADLEGFMKELNDFPMLPMDANSHLDHALGETQFA